MVCCDTACTDTCKSCTVGNMKGTCTNIPYYQEDPSYKDPVLMTPASCTNATGSVCNGAGACLKKVLKICGSDADCISGKCAMPALVCLGAKGEACSSGGACASGSCNAMGACD
jgi:hypothetical protein